MAVYEGARPRSGLFPRRREVPSILRAPLPLSHRRTRLVLRSRRRSRRFKAAIGLIVVAFLLSFFSLIQTVRVDASGYDMSQLNIDYGQLQNQRQQDLSDINRLDRESAIRRQAISDGLSQLPAPVVIPAR